MYYSIQVADYFLRAGAKEGIEFNIQKLMKMVYLAHGLRLAKYDQPLYSDYTESWQYGPIIPMVFNLLKHYKMNTIPVDVFSPEPAEFDAVTKQFLSVIFAKYKTLESKQMATIVAPNGSPERQFFEDTFYADSIKNKDQKYLTAQYRLPNYKTKENFEYLLSLVEQKEPELVD